MNPKPPLFSGRELVKVFKKLGFEKISHRGNHIKLKNHDTETTVIIPDHKEVDRWTLKTILRQAEISEEEFRKHL